MAYFEFNFQLVLKAPQCVTTKSIRHLKRKKEIKSRVFVPSKLKGFFHSYEQIGREGEEIKWHI